MKGKPSGWKPLAFYITLQNQSFLFQSCRAVRDANLTNYASSRTEKDRNWCHRAAYILVGFAFLAPVASDSCAAHGTVNNAGE
jgi:hypothetical protein